MSPDWVLLATMASCIHILQADCILEIDTPVLIPENAFVCMPVNKSLGETEEYFGRRFLACMDSEVHFFECDVGMKFDVVTKDCRGGPPRCDHNEEIPTIPPSPPTTGRNTTSSPQTAARNTTSSPQTTVRNTTSSPQTTARNTTSSPQTTARNTTSSPQTTARNTTSSPTTTSATASPPTTSASSPAPTTSAPPPAPTTSTPTSPPTSSATSFPAPTSNSTLAPVETITPNVSTATGTATQPPPVVDPTAVCTADNCKLPNCFCLGAKPQIEVSDSPMIVMLSFDDAITEAFMVAYYDQLLVENIYSLNNPNNCSIKAAFFLSSADTDYTQVKILYDKGHEFASHTVKHILPDGGTKEEYEDEIVGIRDLLVSKALVDGEKVVGFRAPYLKLAGNQMFEVLHEQKFLYDSSISNIERKKGHSHLWPFTLDFQIPQSKCPNGPCPSQGFPGLWEVPINAWLTADDGHCAMIDACIVANYTDDKETVKDKYFRYFQKNFYESFYPEKVPMHIFTHASVFLRHPGCFEALTDFLQELNGLPDVWFLTPSQAVDWMKKPVTKDEAADGVMSSWNCGGHDTRDGQ